MASTITITNNNTNPMLLGEAVDTTVISPSGITNPSTPYTEYTSDMLTVSNGSVAIPVYNKVQYVVVPAGDDFEFVADDYKEIAYYQGLNILGVTVAVVPVVGP